MVYQLTKAQKDEIRRLTQFANRRIISARNRYKAGGKVVLPSDVVGHFQLQDSWLTAKTPISRSTKFNSEQEYRKQLKMLEQFEQRDDIWTYTGVQRIKTLAAIETALGVPVTEELAERVNNMSATQLTDFWKIFSDRASRHMPYSSGDNMAQSWQDYFQEDIDKLMK